MEDICQKGKRANYTNNKSCNNIIKIHEKEMMAIQTHFFRQVYLQTVYKIRSRYRKTWTGFLWVILNPIILYSVQSFIFQMVLKIEMPHYTVFLLGGLLPWIFINSSLDMGIPILTSSSHLLKGLPVNPLVLILSQVTDNFFNFIVTFLVILIPVLTFTNHWSLHLLTMPISLVLVYLFASVTTIFLSYLNVSYRDTKFVVGFVMSIMYFLTPIFYPPEIIPENLQLFLHLNPIFHLIELFRGAIYEHSLSKLGYHCFVSIIFIGALGSITYRYWRSKKNDIYHLL
jgi:ABC-type polysaccharide/polyol phosphate export permease